MESTHQNSGPWHQSSFQQQWGLVSQLLDHFNVPREAVIYKDGKAIINLPDFLVVVDKYGYGTEYASHEDWTKLMQ